MCKIKEDDVLKVISTALEKSPASININSNSQNIDEWDSLGHLNILMLLEKKLKGKASNISELGKAFSVKKILSVLKKIIFCIKLIDES